MVLSALQATLGTSADEFLRTRHRSVVCWACRVYTVRKVCGERCVSISNKFGTVKHCQADESFCFDDFARVY